MTNIRGELGSAAATLFASEFPISHARQITETAEFPQRLWDAVSAAGWFEALLPESEGGSGLTVPDLGELFGHVGRFLIPLPLLDQMVVLPIVAPIAVDGAAKHVSDCLAGGRRVAVADPGLDVDGRRRDSRLAVASGSLDGRIPYVRSATWVDDLLVIADGALLLVPTAQVGVQIESTVGADPTTRYGTARFENAEFQIIADGGVAARTINTIRSAARLLAAFELGGIAERLLELALAYAKQRHQFGQPIGAFQAVKHLLADASSAVTSLVSLCNACADDAAQDPAGLDVAAMTAKAYASRVARDVAEVSLQIHGGIGFTVEHDLHLYMKRALTLQGFYGDEAELALAIGTRLLASQAVPDGS